MKKESPSFAPVEITITKKSSADEFIDFIHEHFDQESVNSFLSQGTHGVTYDHLNDFVKSPLIDKRLRKLWLYETSPKWEKRSIEEAISETLGHGLGNLWGEIEVYRKNGKGNFADLTSKQVNEIDKNLGIVQAYFEHRFQSIHQTAVENFLSNR